MNPKMLIDTHTHLVSQKGISRTLKDYCKSPKEKEKWINFSKEFQINLTKEFSDKWVKSANKFGIKKVILNAMLCTNDELLKIINFNPNRIKGLAYIDPNWKDLTRELNRLLSNKNIVGLGELGPMWTHVPPTDKKWYKICKIVSNYNKPILFQSGTQMYAFSDFNLGNPLAYDKLIRDFPNQIFIIAHGGKGFYREALMLGEHHDNVYIDIAEFFLGLKFLPYEVKPHEILKKILQIYGHKRILWGSDSIFPYSKSPAKYYVDQFKKLGLKQNEIDHIFGLNAKRIYNIS